MLTLCLTLLSLLMALANPPSAQTPSAPASKALALSDLPPATRSAATRRARFVYRMPDGRIWDSFYYVEFRQVLADFDALGPKAEPSGRLAAWGFKAGKRSPAGKDARPHPLWHSLQQKKTETLVPFLYVNSAILSSRENTPPNHFTLGDEVAPNVFEFRFNEYPNDQSSLVYLPVSTSFGLATGLVVLPPALRPTPNAPLAGEYFIIRCEYPADLPKPKAYVHQNKPVFKLHHAQDLRLTPDQYAAALLQGDAELIEWSFKRTSSRFGDTFTWSRNTINTASPAQK